VHNIYRSFSMSIDKNANILGLNGGDRPSLS